MEWKLDVITVGFLSLFFRENIYINNCGLHQLLSYKPKVWLLKKKKKKKKVIGLYYQFELEKER